eukprot:TRINITY_DN11533_c0_g1_i1.p1 TRINITY_DN11533_c0_g1~~TRINITY_DN11533_c0_g1_i1.p1  ORF type:complete len:537 (+),score=75.17 TRINITY_DN11533_c0_g1_i1:891-2501(+)
MIGALSCIYQNNEMPRRRSMSSPRHPKRLADARANIVGRHHEPARQENQAGDNTRLLMNWGFGRIRRQNEPARDRGDVPGVAAQDHPHDNAEREGDGAMIPLFKNFIATHRFHKLVDQSAICLLGDTGTGKSTTTTILLGGQYNLQPDRNLIQVKAPANNAEQPAVGHERARSKTINANEYFCRELEAYVVDPAGFRDRRGDAFEAWAETSLRCVLASVSELKATVICLEQIHLPGRVARRGDQLEKLSALLFQHFFTQDDFDNDGRNLVFAIKPFNNSRDCRVNDLAEYIDTYATELEGEADRLQGAFRAREPTAEQRQRLERISAEFRMCQYMQRAIKDNRFVVNAIETPQLCRATRQRLMQAIDNATTWTPAGAVGIGQFGFQVSQTILPLLCDDLLGRLRTRNAVFRELERSAEEHKAQERAFAEDFDAAKHREVAQLAQKQRRLQAETEPLERTLRRPLSETLVIVAQEQIVKQKSSGLFSPGRCLAEAGQRPPRKSQVRTCPSRGANLKAATAGTARFNGSRKLQTRRGQ